MAIARIERPGDVPCSPTYFSPRVLGKAINLLHRREILWIESPARLLEERALVPHATTTADGGSFRLRPKQFRDDDFVSLMPIELHLDSANGELAVLVEKEDQILQPLAQRI